MFLLTSVFEARDATMQKCEGPEADLALWEYLSVLTFDVMFMGDL
jgi:hypothetical protein